MVGRVTSDLGLTPNDGRPHLHEFSLVCPLYNVGRYLPEFFDSLEKQDYGVNRLEIILVDDGSSDSDTSLLARRFCEKNPASRKYIYQRNSGQASARNAGIAIATGTWLTFPDPDDKLGPNYFSSVSDSLADAIGNGACVDAMSAKILMWHPHKLAEPVRDNHALTWRYAHGNKLVDLSEHPNWVQPHATSGFVRREVVERFGVTFPTALRYRFEDGCFMSEYFLRSTEKPTVLFVPQAAYYYRQREDESSTIQISRHMPQTYVDTIDVGFRHLVKITDEQDRDLPRWLQTLFLYDQFWVLRASQGGPLRRTKFPQEMYDSLSALIPWFLNYIDIETIQEFSLMPVLPWMREALMAIKTGNHGVIVYKSTHDAQRGLQAYIYRYSGQQPDEEFTRNGLRIEPRYSKNVGLEYAGRPIAWQRIVWLPDDGSVSIRIAGEVRDVTHRPRKPPLPWTTQSILQPPSDRVASPRFSPKVVLRKLAKAVERRLRPGRREYIWLDLVTRLGLYRRRYDHAWVFIDRDTDANDSAEDLYRWTAANRPEVNSWFLIRKTSADWERLEADGVRLIPYGTLRHWAALANAAHLASSHADRFISHSVPGKIRRGYKFTFLQHGVIKGDISSWLNPKHIDLFITSTEAEYSYVSGDSPFRFSKKEVRLTGLPRHDALARLKANQLNDGKRIILIMPTWRNYLVSEMGGTSAQREGASKFAESTFAQEWGALLRSNKLKTISRQSGFQVVFMPHPNMQAHLASFDVPKDFTVASYEETDLRPLLARSAFLITDYSSMAFNAAYLDVPMAYFQFDHEEYFNGHTERPGYFNYLEDGFGPVCLTVESLLEALETGLAQVSSPYTTRMLSTFPVKDGRNCERVFGAMQELTIKRPSDARERAAEPDFWAR
ncbi:CDP-glycerol glycerophosphotransferase family protein [Leucobacter aridicollis]|uniref:CDP-glycerol glycerophosphotransferase family protein n=1 Tax=Leucobacter aridicollis TaxID=283878 RepID=UPI00210659CB|nr:CDP-glycerol glycerophosphotransferase family protein [Leucobacter aridicollis]UTX53523.1 CDP-glycerol glycerophosphotransferase family protein [Leucobacter aridicollis]